MQAIQYMDNNMLRLPEELHRAGYDKEAQYFYRHDRELIEMREHYGQILEESTCTLRDLERENRRHRSFLRALRRYLNDFEYREIEPHYF